jgi:predicted O-methyltransferase YrrM
LARCRRYWSVAGPSFPPSNDPMPGDATSSTHSRLREAVRTSLAGRVALLPRRYRAARTAGTWSRTQVLRWLGASREYTNFTYPLTPTSEHALASVVARVLGVDEEQVFEAMRELHEDEALARHVVDTTRKSSFRHTADAEARYGRRSAWYAFTRLAKPGLVVEAGVDKGLGACVFASALLPHADKGNPGRYIGLDIDRTAGWLIAKPYDEVAQIRYGDSVTSLAGISKPIDLFLHDSDHSPPHERAEYLAVAAKLSRAAIVLSDNAHVTDELREFAAATGRRFEIWHETPRAHWYRGSATGVAWHPAVPTQ